MKRVSKAIAVLMLALSLAAPTLAAEIPIESAPTISAKNVSQSRKLSSAPF